SAGTVIEFQNAFKFNVQGRLLALGNVNERIIFTALNPAVGWKGIRFHNTPATNDTSIIEFCIIQYGNATGLDYYDKMGGGIFVYNFSKLIIRNNIITNNQAQYYGAGIACWYYANPIIVNNLICHNTASSVAGGVMIYQYSNPVFLGNTVVYNKSNSYGGGIYCYYSTTEIKNCIVYGNDGSMYDQVYPSNLTTISYSDIQDGYQGTGNIDEDPDFVDPAAGPGNNYDGLKHNYSVSTASPIIDAGTAVSYGYLYPGVYDIDGNLRVDGVSIDMGAYEYVSSLIGCGTISTNTTWSGSVVMTCNVTVMNGKVLTISPGTRIKILGDYKLVVQGKIYAVGKNDSMITFNAVDKIAGWQGIRFENVSTSNDTSKIEYCIIQDGNANGLGSMESYGGGLYISYTPKLIVRNNIISNNYAKTYGGGIYLRYSSAKLVGNLVVNNECRSSYGGGIYISNSTSSSYTPYIVNNTISNNKSTNYAGGLYLYSSYATVKNNIIYGNTGGLFVTVTQKNLYIPTSSPMSTITYSDIAGGIYTGSGNISSTPLFKKSNTRIWY
ncbi:right-handed parallel beta-helix repeat-containing protein, partial [Bacteroidota bacterium]